MSVGIRAYGDLRAQEAATEAGYKVYVETSQEYNQSLTDTIKKFIDKFHVDAKEAEEEVKKYWVEEGEKQTVSA